MSDVDTSAGAGSVEGQAPAGGAPAGGAPAGDAWTSGIEDRAVLDQVGNYKSAAELATAYAGLRKERDGLQHVIGKKAADIAADPELMAIARTHLPGMTPPGSADDYDFSAIGDEVRAVGWDDSQEAAWRAFAYENGLSKEQFDGQIRFYGEQLAQRIADRQDELNAKADQTEAVLRREWGRAYQGKINDVRSVLQRFPEGFREQLFSDGSLADTDVVAALAEIADELRGVGGLPGAGSDKGAAAMTPEQAKVEHDLLVKEFVAMDRQDPDDPEVKRITAKIAELAQAMTADG